MKKDPKTVKVVSLRMVREKSARYEAISGRSDVRNLMKPLMQYESREVVYIIGLDTSNRPSVIYLVGAGTVNSCNAFTSDICKVLLLANCSAGIMVHNHPGGSMKASTLDIQLTGKIKKAMEMFDIVLLDHIILNPECTEICSLRDGGHL